MKNLKLWIRIVSYILISIIVLILILQNSSIVEFKFLGFLFSAPLVFLLLICLFLGFLLGMLTILLIYPKNNA
ncbi:MAG: lipopolysaccharide assembly protein LapA domain-containing protein [Brevinematales bacterium]|nr:lipopolysaccharide assembly protein LapA domain-containing protein [Brevinematales bacterium]